MKILFILNSGFDTSGPSNHILETLIEESLISGCDVHIIEKHRTGQNSDIPPSLSLYVHLTYDVIPTVVVEKSNFIKRYLADVKYAFSCAKYYKKQKGADVIFVQSCNTALFHICLLKTLVKKPIIFNVQDIWPINASTIGMLKEKGLVYKAFRMLQRFAYKKADKIITISEDMKKTLVGEGVSENKIVVINNWSYTDEIFAIPNDENAFMKNNQIACDKFKVVYAGNIGSMQNIDIIVGAAELLKEENNIHFYMIGDGGQKNRYLEHVKSLGLNNITFFPLQPPEIAPHVYSMADINVIPLFRGVIRTALPSKTAICLASGKPIIACVDLDSEFARKLDGCENCTVVEPESKEQLANKIFYNYENNITGYSQDLRAYFKDKFSKAKNSRKYVDVLKDWPSANN